MSYIYDSQIQKFSRFGMNAIDRLLENYSELALSLDGMTGAKLAAISRLRASELPELRNESDVYSALERIFGELLRDGKFDIASFGFSTEGRNQYRKLVTLANSSPEAQTKEPADSFADIIHTYKNNVAEFNQRRKDDPDFRVRSDKAQELRLLQ